MDNSPDHFYKKIISFFYEGEELRFRVSQELFSSQIIDYGTQRLLRTLATEGLNKFSKALDLGCGYGPIGLTLKKLNQSGVVHMVDRDALALDYSRQNAKLNGINDVQIYGSLGYDSIKDNDFDLIVSNIPAKVGDQVLSHLLKDARFYLRPNGRVAIVVIDAISKYVTDALSADRDAKILFRKSWPGHIILHYTFSPDSVSTKSKSGAFLRGVYDRSENKFSCNKRTLSLQTTYNLPEFDTLNYGTKLLLDNLHFVAKKNVDAVIIYNPGQGYVPVALSQLAQVNKIILVDRNLQSLEVSKRNLISNKYPANQVLLSHQVGISGGIDKVDCIVGIVPDKQNSEVYKMLIEQSVQQLKVNGLIIFASSSTTVKRIERIIRSNKGLIILSNKHSKGKIVIIVRRK